MSCPAFLSQHSLWTSLVIGGLANGFLYALIAIGYTLVYGVLRLINFAHSEVFMMGSFGTFFVMRGALGSTSPGGTEGLIYLVLAVAAGALFGGLVGFALERVAYRPLRLRDAPRLTYLITAIGASFFLQYFAAKEFGTSASFVPEPAMVSGNAFSLCGAPVQSFSIVIVVVSVVMLVLTDTIVRKTKLGRGIRAVAQDAEVASLMGVNIDRTISTTFILGGALGGVAGALWGMQFQTLYLMGFDPGLKAFSAAVLGGIGNLRGAMLGGILLGLVESVSLIWFSAAYEDVVAFVVLIGVLMFRPTGLLGERLGRVA